MNIVQRRITFSNRKGGCGKTASAVNVAAALALLGRKVLLIDCDAQAHASISLGFFPYNTQKSLYDLLIGTYSSVLNVVQQSNFIKNLFVLPATSQLAAFELEFAGHTEARFRLSQLLLAKDASEFDYILMDPPPTVGLLSLMTLVSAKEVVIPVQLHFLGMEGLAEMVRYVYQVNATINPDIRITGIIPTFYNQSTRLAKNILDEIEKTMGKDIVLPPIRQNVSIAEAPSFGKCVLEYAPKSIGSEDFKRLAQLLDQKSKSR
ncbi:MAG: ParA family protein [Desulfobacterales bacterium]|nr:ParA family protein [Desulfobacterales bacterium]